MSSGTPGPKKYRAHIEGQSIELEVRPTDAVVDGDRHEYTAAWLDDDRVSLVIDGRSYSADVYRRGDSYIVHVGGREFEVALQTEKDLLLQRFGLADAAKEGHQEIRAPMPGLVLSLHVAEGDEVAAGDAIVVLEAMKMENELRAAGGGIVRAVKVAVGDAVGKNDLLVEIES